MYNTKPIVIQFGQGHYWVGRYMCIITNKTRSIMNCNNDQQTWTVLSRLNSAFMQVWILYEHVGSQNLTKEYGHPMVEMGWPMVSTWMQPSLAYVNCLYCSSSFSSSSFSSFSSPFFLYTIFSSSTVGACSSELSPLLQQLRGLKQQLYKVCTYIHVHVPQCIGAWRCHQVVYKGTQCIHWWFMMAQHGEYMYIMYMQLPEWQGPIHSWEPCYK